jgi:hypothetical protein
MEEAAKYNRDLVSSCENGDVSVYTRLDKRRWKEIIPIGRELISQ